MRIRMLTFLTASTLLIGSAVAMAPASASAKAPSASLAAGHHGKVVAPATAPLAGKCRTLIGTPLATPDGILSWSGSGYDTGGAADFSCPRKKAKRTFSTVTVNGYYGDAGSTTFNVTVYSDLNGEPNNGAPAVCPTQTVIGSPTGSQYPTNDTTVIPLATPCRARPGVNWLEVQAVTSSGIPWYWETQNEQQGNQADWRDTNGSFGTPCTPGYQDGFYMQDCVFGGPVGENDFIFVLS